MTTQPDTKPPGWWIERLFAMAVLIGLGWSLSYLAIYKYLPTPFYFEPYDTWMDFFNTAYWAHEPGAYDNWGTLYPPLSFVVLRFITDHRCYAFAEQYSSRDCDVFGLINLHLIYIFNIFLTARTLIKLDRRTAVPRAIALTAGLPMLFALERGNIIILCYTCLLLAYGPLVRSARVRWFFAACTVNFKVYLIGGIVAQLLRRRWRWFEGSLLMTIVIYLLSYSFMGAGTPAQIYANITYYQTGFLAATPLDIMYTSTYLPLLYVLRGNTFPIINAIGSGPVELLTWLLPVLMNSTVILAFFAALTVAIRPYAVPLHRLLVLSIGSALVSSEAGIYTVMFIVLFIFMEPFRGPGRIYSIIVSYIICIPADIPLYYIPPLVRESYLGGGPIVAEYIVGTAPFIRPLLLLTLVVVMSLVTIRQVWDKLRSEGWEPGFGRDQMRLLISGARQPRPL